jgi:hypothetical protein
VRDERHSIDRKGRAKGDTPRPQAFRISTG